MMKVKLSQEIFIVALKKYISYEIGLRKPDENAFKYVINNHNLNPKTLFIDDKKKIQMLLKN